MSKDNNIPLCYQITVSNIIKIGDKVMSDYYVIFKSAQKNQHTWQSPLIHGKLTKENSNFPWNFIIDNPKLTVEFCEIDDRSKKGMVLGSTPLLLMKKEGEEQFLIFGCKQQNRGRKVAQVQFTYVQCSLARSNISSEAKKQTKKSITQKNDSDSNRRVDLQFSTDNEVKPSGLNIILQQDVVKQTLNQSQIEDKKYITVNPSKLETLQYSYRNDKSVSYNDFEVLREMEDATDKWYRSNFGKNKPTNLENIQLQNENTLLPVKYTRQFEYLNNLSTAPTYIQLKNILVNLNQRPKTIEIFAISLQNQQMKKAKIATVQCNEGYRRDWKTLIRLPVEAKGYELQIISDKNERFYSMIGNDGRFEKHKVDIYDDDGQVNGNLLFSLKPIKTMEIQTLDNLLQNPINEKVHQKQEDTVNEQLNLSFIKSNSHFNFKDKSTKLQKESYLVPRFQQNSSHQKLQNQAYFQKYRNQFAQSPFIPQQKTNKAAISEPQNKSRANPKSVFQNQGNMSNQAYIGKNPVSTKGRFRRNQYELAENHSSEISQLAQSKQYHTLSEQNNKTKLLEDFNNSQSPKTLNQEKTLPNQKSIKKRQQFKHPEPIRNITTIDDFANKGPPRQVKNEQNQPFGQKQLDKKIEEIKKLSIQLQKIAKNSSPVKFKTQKNQEDYYNPVQRQRSFYKTRKVQFPNDQDEERGKVVRKKTYRDPINVTPFFTSFSGQSFKKQRSKNRQYIEEELPLKNKSKKNQLEHHYSPTSIEKNKKWRQNLMGQRQTQLIYKSQRQPKVRMNKDNERQKQKQGSQQRQLGVNTDRMAIVKNILQTSYMPEISTEKKNQNYDKSKTNKHEDQNLYRQETGSNFDSLLQQNLNHHTKYSSQTIQPTTNQALIDFLLVTISVQTYQNIFGAKFLRVYVPNKYHYQTERIKSNNNLIWECKGFVFNHISVQESLYIELVSESMDNNLKIGKAKIGGVEFKHVKKQGVIRSYLAYQNEVVGEVILTFKNAAKNNELIGDQFTKNRKNNTANQYKANQLLEKQTAKVKTPKNSKSPKKSKSKGKKRSDSLTDVIKSKRKQKLSRYILNDYSRAHVEQRVNPIRQKKYEGGRNIVIGRNIRFPLSEEQQYHQNVPGPGAYQLKNEFKKYS